MPRPTFILSDTSQVVTATGKHREFDSLDAARRQRGTAVVGAVSFDPAAPDCLWEPDELLVRAVPKGRPAAPVNTATAAALAATTADATTSAAATANPSASGAPAPCPAGGECCTVTATAQTPGLDEHRGRISDVVARIRSGAADKVVIGRAERLEFAEPVDAVEVFERFRASDPAGNAYFVDLGQEVLVGSSPELLVARRGTEVTAFPLAGTCRRGEGTDDERRAAELLASEKDRAEHEFVTLALREALEPVCSELDIPAEPCLVAAPTTWHLGTPIRGTLRDPDVTILDLVARTHPTPAVCGSPDLQALDIIRAVEGEGARGFFGGALGFSTADGDGSFRVTIRGIALDRDGRHATAWAGGGLTADSNPETELQETVIKLARARQGMGAHA